MSRKTKESGNIGFSTLETIPDAEKTPIPQTTPEQPAENTSAEPLSQTPTTGPQVPQVPNPSKTRKPRGPYKPRQPKAQQSQPDQVQVTISKDSFRALATVYGAILQAAELPPPLSSEEKSAIVDAAHACATKYASSFEHWEIAALAAALVAPAAMRLMAKYRDANETEKHAAPQAKAPEPVTVEPIRETRQADLFQKSSATSEIVASA